jgi:MoaA/NifB/PqqE/SkfB family radical SAM enzyme
MHVRACIDSAEAARTSGKIVLRGWLWAEQGLRRCFGEGANGELAPILTGLERPDVAAAFPEFASATTAGCCVVFSPGACHGGGCLWVQTEHGAWHRLALSWDTRQPLVWDLGPTTLVSPPPEALVQAQQQAEDAETKLLQACEMGGGLTLRMDIINKCNLRCVMCHYSQDKIFFRPTKAFTLEEFSRLFDGIAPYVQELVLSCADEPLTSKYFGEILAHARRLRPDLSIKVCTNAMLMTSRVRRLLVEQQVDQILFSLDGVQAATLEQIRIGARFDRLVQHIAALRDLRDRAGSQRPDFLLNFVMMVRNLHEAPLFVALAKRLGASAVDFRHVVATYYPFSLPQEQLQNQPGRFNYYRELILAEGRRFDLNLYLPPAFVDTPPWIPGPDEPTATLAEFDEQISRFQPDPLDAPLDIVPSARRLNQQPHADLFSSCFCDRPFSEITIRYQEEVLPCPWYEFPLGHLSLNPDLKAIFFNERFRLLRANMLKPEGDAGCRRCPIKARELPVGTPS